MWCLIAEASFQNIPATLVATYLTGFPFLVTLQILPMLVIANYSAFILSKFQHCRQLSINNLRYFHSTECTWFCDLLHERSEKRNCLTQGTTWTTWGIKNIHAIFLTQDLVDVFHGEALISMEMKTVSPFHSFFISDDCLFPRCQLPWASFHSFGRSRGWSIFVVTLQWEWTQRWWDGCRIDVSRGSSWHETAARDAFLAMLMVGWQWMNDMDTSCQEGCK